MKKTEISREEVQAILHYEPSTGVFTWKVRKAMRIHVGDVAGKFNNVGYLQIGINKTYHCAHRLAWLYVYGYLPTCDIDHIDRDRANNRIANLRLATRSENLENTVVGKRSKSGLKGVTWNSRSKKWVARIKVPGGPRINLGYFACPGEAYAAYQRAAAKHHKFNPCAAA